MFEIQSKARPYLTIDKNIFTKSVVTENDIKNLSEEDLTSIYDKFFYISKKNIEIRKENQSLFNEFKEEFIENFEGMGLTVKGTRGGILKQYRTILNEIEESFYLKRIPLSISEYSNSFIFKNEKISIPNTENRLERFKLFKQKCDLFEKNELKNNVLYQASLDFAKKKSVNINGLSIKEVIAIVRKEAIKEYLEEEYPNGTEIEIDDNYCECALWTVGDYRCSCGSVRMYFDVEGDIVNGFSAIPYVN